MDSTTNIIFLFWLPQAIIQVLNWTYWLQVKEYRFDRFKLLFSSIEGRRNLGILTFLSKLAVFLLFFILKLPTLTLLIPLLYLDFKDLLSAKSKGLTRPVFTQRAIIILLLTFVLAVLSVLLGQLFALALPQVIIVTEISLILGITLGAILTLPLVFIAKKEAIIKAKAILKKVNPVVIGVTGSYGKSSTKDFITHLLSKKFIVAKTEGSENTELGVLRRVIQSVGRRTQFFVAEMGAYKRGEIERLCNIVEPRIGMITGIEPQHLALFGSKEKIVKTKFELIENLPAGGTAIFNLSNEDCRKMFFRAQKLKRKLRVYGYALEDNIQAGNADIKAKILSANEEGIFFEIKSNNFRKSLFSPLKGTHFVENLAGAILVARLFEVSWNDIEVGCAKMKAPFKTMEVFRTKSEGTIIDDSYNSTPKGFLSALNYLKLLKNKRKVVFTPGIIELGSYSQEAHREIAKEMSNKASELVLISKDFYEVFRDNLKKTRLTLISNRKILTEKISDEIDNGSAILLEGRMPSIIYSILERHKSK